MNNLINASYYAIKVWDTETINTIHENNETLEEIEFIATAYPTNDEMYSAMLGSILLCKNLKKLDVANVVNMACTLNKCQLFVIFLITMLKRKHLESITISIAPLLTTQLVQRAKVEFNELINQFKKTKIEAISVSEYIITSVHKTTISIFHQILHNISINSAVTAFSFNVPISFLPRARKMQLVVPLKQILMSKKKVEYYGSSIIFNELQKVLVLAEYTEKAISFKKSKLESLSLELDHWLSIGDYVSLLHYLIDESPKLRRFIFDNSHLVVDSTVADKDVDLIAEEIRHLNKTLCAHYFDVFHCIRLHATATFKNIIKEFLKNHNVYKSIYISFSGHFYANDTYQALSEHYEELFEAILYRIKKEMILEQFVYVFSKQVCPINDIYGLIQKFTIISDLTINVFCSDNNHFSHQCQYFMYLYVMNNIKYHHAELNWAKKKNWEITLIGQSFLDLVAP